MVEVQYDRRGPGPPVLVTELIVAVGWQLEGGPHTPNPFARGRGRQERAERRVANAVGVAVARTQRRVPDYRHDRPRDDVPVLIDADRDHRLDVEDVLRA